MHMYISSGPQWILSQLLKTRLYTAFSVFICGKQTVRRAVRILCHSNDILGESNTCGCIVLNNRDNLTKA